MKRLKVGIIGAGGIAQYAHIPSYKKSDKVEITAIADINEEKLKYAADKFEIPRRFVNWEDMLDEDLDIVSICSPNAFHALQSIKSMENGKHVLCEKPLCLTEKEVDDVFGTSVKTGMKFMGAMPRRFSGETAFLKKLIDKGEIGEIYYIKASYLRRRGIPGLGSWFTNKKLAGGGPMMDIGVHAIDFIVYITGLNQPEMVMGSSYNRLSDSAIDGGWPPMETRKGDKFIGDMDVEEISSGFVRFKGGETLFIEAGWAGNCEPASRVSILGTKAGIQMPDPENVKNPIRIYGETEGILTDTLPVIPKSDMFQEEINHFIECVRENKETGTRKEEIMAVTRIINSIYKSAEEGKPVRIGER